MKSLNSFDKEKYDFIPNQLINNVGYFIHSLEKFLETEDWFGCITEYIDYLVFSLGQPTIGGNILEHAIKYIIENIELEKTFTDDQRLKILEYLEPSKKK